MCRDDRRRQLLVEVVLERLPRHLVPGRRHQARNVVSGQLITQRARLTGPTAQVGEVLELGLVRTHPRDA